MSDFSFWVRIIDKTLDAIAPMFNDAGRKRKRFRRIVSMPFHFRKGIFWFYDLKGIGGN